MMGKQTLTTNRPSAARRKRPAQFQCLLSRVREDLHSYRQRLQFAASNIPLSDPHSRSLLTELLSFDRWMGAQVQRCQACGGAR